MGKAGSGKRRILIGIAITGLILILIDNISIPGHSRWTREMNNAGHIPLFGILSLALLAVIRSAWSQSWNRPWTCYMMAFAGAGLLGAGSELMQYLGPRDADLWDLFRDLVGAGTFLAVFATFDQSKTRLFEDGSHRVRAVIRWAGFSLLAIGFYPVMLWSAAFYHRDTQMPLLCNFDSYLHTRFVQLQDATLKMALGGDNSHRGAMLTFGQGSYPGFSLEDVYPDWTAYDSLIIEIHSPADSIITLVLRIDDVHHVGVYEDRYTGRLTISPDANRIAISLWDIKHGSNQRLQDMQQIAAIWIYGDSSASGAKILMQRISLK